MAERKVSKELKALHKALVYRDRVLQCDENGEVNELILEALEAFEKRLDKLEK